MGVMGVGQRTIAEILAAIATTELVTAFLDRSAERDPAIERLADDISVARRMLVRELRTRLVPHARAALRASRPSSGWTREPRGVQERSGASVAGGTRTTIPPARR